MLRAVVVQRIREHAVAAVRLIDWGEEAMWGYNQAVKDQQAKEREFLFLTAFNTGQPG